MNQPGRKEERFAGGKFWRKKRCLLSVDAQILAILEKLLTEWQEVLRRSVQAIVQPKAENQGETRKKQRCKNENIRNLARRFCIRFRACCGVARSALGVVVSGDLVESLGTAYEDRPLPIRREEFVSLPGGKKRWRSRW